VEDKLLPQKEIYKVKKGWGYELWIHNDEDYCGKILHINVGKKCSLHFHLKKKETFYLQKGKILLTIIYNDGEKSTYILDVGDSMEISRGLVHQMEALEDSDIIEFSTQHFDSDSYRIKKGD